MGGLETSPKIRDQNDRILKKMKILTWVLFLAIVFFSQKERCEELDTFKDDYIGIYTSVKGKPIRLNSRKNLIEHVTEGSRIYIDDEINTSKNDQITCLFEDKSLVFLSNQTNLKINNFRTSGTIYYQVKHGKIRMHLPARGERVGIAFGDKFTTFLKMGRLVADLYTNQQNDQFLELIPLEESIDIFDNKNKKYHLEKEQLTVINQTAEDYQTFNLRAGEYSKILSGLNGYRFLFDIKKNIIDQSTNSRLARELDPLINQNTDKDYVLDKEYREIVDEFSSNPYYESVNKMLTYHQFNIGLKDIPTYQNYIEEYARLETKKKEIITNMDFTKAQMRDADQFARKSVKSGAFAEVKLLKESLNDLLEQYSEVLFKQEKLAIDIGGLKRNFVVEQSQKRSPAEIEIEIENQKNILAKEKEREELEKEWLRLKNYEMEIQKIELMLERIRYARYQMSHKQEQEKRDPSLKEFAQLSLLDEAKTKLKDKRKYLLDQQRFEREKTARVKIKDDTVVDLYDIKRTPASNSNKLFNHVPSQFFDLQKFLNIEDKMRLEAQEKLEEFSRDSNYQVRQKFQKKIEAENKYMHQIESLDLKAHQ